VIYQVKLRLVLRTKTKSNKDVKIKLNITPSKHLGFISFINYVLSQDKPVTLSFEKIGKSGEKEEITVEGSFKLQGKGDLKS
jgi:hypothetical protein